MLEDHLDEESNYDDWSSTSSGEEEQDCTLSEDVGPTFQILAADVDLGSQDQGKLQQVDAIGVRVDPVTEEVSRAVRTLRKLCALLCDLPVERASRRKRGRSLPSHPGNRSQPTALIALVMPHDGVSISALSQQLLRAGADDVALTTGADVRTPIVTSLLRLRVARRRSGMKIEDRRKTLCEKRGRVKELEGKRTEIIWEWVARALKFPDPVPSISDEADVPSAIGVLRLDVQPVGFGTFGTVYRARNVDSGEPEAVKVVLKANVETPEQLAALHREFTITRSVGDHAHVVRMLPPLLSQRHLFLRMDFAGSINLNDLQTSEGLATGFSSAKAWSYFSHATAGAAHLHSAMVCHLDIQPSNLVIDERGVVKIVDFGFARSTKRLVRKACGRPPYTAPEVLCESEFDGTSADVWSLGSTLLDFCFGPRALSRALSLSSDEASATRKLGLELARQLADTRAVVAQMRESFGARQDLHPRAFDTLTDALQPQPSCRPGAALLVS